MLFRSHELDRQQQVLARCAEHFAVALEPGVDRREHLDRRAHGSDERRVAPRLGYALEPDVALLAQPVERLALERNAIRDLIARAWAGEPPVATKMAA